MEPPPDQHTRLLSLPFIFSPHSHYHPVLQVFFFVLFCLLILVGCKCVLHHCPLTSPLLHPSHCHGNGHATVLGKHHYACTKREREISAKIGVSKPVSICDLMSSALQPSVTFNLLLWPGGGCEFC